MAKRSKSKKTYSEDELAAMSAADLERLLTEKQRAFVREYLLERNGTRAAIKAGYRAGKDNHTAAVTAARLLKDPVVTACRLALQKEAFAQLGISLESVCAELVEIKERCMQAKPVMVWDSESRSYVESGEWAFDAKGATRALVELADLLGLKEQGRGRESVRVELAAAAVYAE